MIFDEPITKWKPFYSYAYVGASYLVFTRLMQSGLLQFKTVKIDGGAMFRDCYCTVKINTQDVFDELIGVIKDE